MTDELFICKVTEVGLDFFPHLVRSLKEYLEENYPEYKGYMRNASDGTYELFAIKKTEKPS
jgi:hypothetical protein